MKKIFCLTLFAALFLIKLGAQTENQIKNLLLEQKSIANETAVVWKPETRQLQIGQHLIPISENTHLQIDRNEDKQLVVEFLLQKGTAVTNINDAAFRRAYWAIPF
jgi:hypothetical protein